MSDNRNAKTPRLLLITGGSRGIGRATARLAAGAGFEVVLTFATDEAAAADCVREIENAGGRARAIQADVAEEADVLRVFDALDEHPLPLSAVVNNAGILDTQMRLEAMEVARMRRIFEVNILGAFLVAREAVRRMSHAFGGQGGALVNVSSRAAVLGSPNEYIDYAASKGALDTMTLGLSKEMADQGVRVNGVRPGLINTEMHASGGEPGRVERLRNAIPMQRGGETDEVAQAVLWLLSPEASYVTGSFIDVGGGR